MPNFSAIVRRSYADIDGLILDCRASDIPADIGTHNGVSNSAILSDSTAAWTENALVGGMVHNVSSGERGTITANTGTTITAPLSGGGLWDNGDTYSVVLPTFEWVNRAPPARALVQGSHTGPNFSATLIDASHTWQDNELVGRVVYNTTTGTWVQISANTAHEVWTAFAGVWMTGDTYDMTTPRCGNPYQPVVARCPVPVQTGGPTAPYEARFVRANTNRLIIPLEYDVPLYIYSSAVDISSIGADMANNQALLGLPNYQLIRRTAAGVRAYIYNGISCSGLADLTNGVWVQQGRWFGGVNSGQLWNNGILDFASTDAGIIFLAGNPAGYISCNAALANHVDLSLRGVQLWTRPLGDLEVDFAFQSLSELTNHNQDSRCIVYLDVWTDDTNQNVAPFTGLLRRINPVQNAPQKFYRGIYWSGTASRVQLAAMVNGRTLDDGYLGGNLFQWIPMEYPSPTPPAMYTTPGTSAVCDMLINCDGHYTVQCYRPNGGSIILHVDVEGV